MAADYPRRVEITLRDIESLQTYSGEAGGAMTRAAVKRWLESLPPVPEPEQRACKDCRWQKIDRAFGWDGIEPRGIGWCGHPDAVSSYACNCGCKPARVKMPWVGCEHGCTRWEAEEPRRDKADELAEALVPAAKSYRDRLIDETEMLARYVRVLREAGIGGESDGG